MEGAGSDGFVGKGIFGEGGTGMSVLVGVEAVKGRPAKASGALSLDIRPSKVL